MGSDPSAAARGSAASPMATAVCRVRVRLAFPAGALLGLACSDAGLVVRDRLGRRVLQRSKLSLHRVKVSGLLIERELRCLRRLLGRFHLLFSDLLKTVTFVTRHLRLIRQGLGGVA